MKSPPQFQQGVKMLPFKVFGRYCIAKLLAAKVTFQLLKPKASFQPSFYLSLLYKSWQSWTFPSFNFPVSIFFLTPSWGFPSLWALSLFLVLPFILYILVSPGFCLNCLLVSQEVFPGWFHPFPYFTAYYSKLWCLNSHLTWTCFFFCKSSGFYILCLAKESIFPPPGKNLRLQDLKCHYLSEVFTNFPKYC